MSLSQRSEGLVSAHAGGRVHRLADSGAGALPAALAIRTVELLKAMSVEGGDGEPETPVEEPKAQAADLEPVQVATKSVDSRPFGSNSVVPVGPRNITMSVGAIVFGGFARLASAYGPTLTVGRRTSDHVLLSLVLAGPMFAGDQPSANGRASVRHEMAAFQVDLLGLFWNAVVLRAGVGAGVYHVQVNGQGFAGFTVPETGEVVTAPVSGSAGGFAGLLSWSAGIAANLRSDVGIFLEGRMFVLTPTPVILLNGTEVGRAGNPGLALSSGIELRF
ncbi:MAG: hypothetical protein H7X95_08270 [Deltaproteobacteria bacterium]|nr:hypothetical protein [Deltaproteobacteria bacterium]